jgi:hypothetical protein
VKELFATYLIPVGLNELGFDSKVILDASRCGCILRYAQYLVLDADFWGKANELLDFVHLRHSSFPDPSTFILSFNAPTAAGRFNSPVYQLSIHVRGSEHSSWSSPQEKLVAQDL